MAIEIKYCKKHYPRSAKEYGTGQDEYNEFLKYVAPNVKIVNSNECDSCKLKKWTEDSFKEEAIKRNQESWFKVKTLPTKLAIRQFEFIGREENIMHHFCDLSISELNESVKGKIDEWVCKHVKYDSTRAYGFKDGKLRLAFNIDPYCAVQVKSISGNTWDKVEAAYINLNQKVKESTQVDIFELLEGDENGSK